MRAFLIGLGSVIVLGSFGTSVQAQDGGFSDPFFLYYGYFLPRQNALAAQAQPEDYYRAQSIQRQAAAQTDRQGLYDPLSSIGLDELDPLRPFGSRSGSTRMVATTPMGLRTSVSQRGHSAPGSYYARTSAAGKTYYPTLRSGFGGARARGGAPLVSGPPSRMPTVSSMIPNARSSR